MQLTLDFLDFSSNYFTYEILDTLLALSGSQYPHLYNGDNNSYLGGLLWDQVTGKGWREWHAEGINESYLSLRFAAFQRKNENYKANGFYTNSIFNILIKEMCFIYHYSHLIVYRLVMCNLSRTLPPIVWFVLWVFLVISLLS